MIGSPPVSTPQRSKKALDKRLDALQVPLSFVYAEKDWMDVRGAFNFAKKVNRPIRIYEVPETLHSYGNANGANNLGKILLGELLHQGESVKQFLFGMAEETAEEKREWDLEMDVRFIKELLDLP